MTDIKDKTFAFRPQPPTAAKVTKYMNVHKCSQTEALEALLQESIKKAQQSPTISKLQTELELKRQIREVAAATLQDKVNAQKELDKLKEEATKQRARDRAVRRQPKIDWKGAAGSEQVNYGDGFYG